MSDKRQEMGERGREGGYRGEMRRGGGGGSLHEQDVSTGGRGPGRGGRCER